MALIAVVKMTILDLLSKKAKFVGTITDDVSGREITGEILETTVDTDNLQSELARVTDGVFANYTLKKAKQDAVDALVSTWETALTAALQTKVDG